MKIRPPFKMHGGKYYLNSWIIENMPANYEQLDYIEPFCGAANVLINKNQSNLEVISDIDEKIIFIMKALRDSPEKFIKKIKNTTYSENVFNKSLKNKELEDEFDIAVNEFILRRMSRGGMKKNFAWSERKRGGLPGDVNAWKTISKELFKITKRLEKVIILNKSAFEIIETFNYENALIYADPPYVPDTRISKNVYDNEMTLEEHEKLGNLLNRFKGKVIISGYPSTLYKKLFKEWKCIKKKIPNHSSQKKQKDIKTECLWVNFS